MSKEFNYNTARKFFKSKRNEKIMRHAHSRILAKKMATKKRQNIERIIIKLQLPKVAQEIIKNDNIPATERGKKILREELRAGFLRNLEMHSKRITIKESIALKMAKNSAEIYRGVWKNKYCSIPLEEAYKMYVASAEILRRAVIETKGNNALKEKFILETRNIAKTAQQLKNVINKKEIGSVNPGSRKELRNIAELGENLVDHLYEDLPEYSKIGFKLIDKIVANAFEVEQ